MLPPNDSPFWKLMTYIVVGTVLCVMLAIGYKNGWTTQDAITVFTALGSLFGVHAVQSFARKNANE